MILNLFSKYINYTIVQFSGKKMKMRTLYK